MKNNDEIILDPKSGISLEEQKEILTQINGIAEKNRQSLSQGDSPVINAKKSGAFFPLAVNIAALFLLAGGVLFLFWFNGRMDANVRIGSAVYNLTERALIEEIRKETAQRIEAKETEIFSIASRLEEVDSELLLLQSSNQELTAEQRSAQEKLLLLQTLYREDLAGLREERAKILEESHSKEARLRAVLEERAREAAASGEKTDNELDEARKELARLFGEQKKIAALEALIAQIQISGSEDDAVLREKNAQLENSMAEMQKTIEAFSSGSSGQARRLLELEEIIKSLDSDKNTLSQTIASRDSVIKERDISIRDLQSLNDIQAAEILNLRNQISIIRQTLQTLQDL